MDDLPPEVLRACAEEDPHLLTEGSKDSERLQAALLAVGNLLNTVVSMNHCLSSLQVDRRTLRYCAAALRGAYGHHGTSPEDRTRLRSACGSTVGNAFLGLMEYLCGESRSARLGFVWDSVCAIAFPCQ